jgi:hypothetical protein
VVRRCQVSSVRPPVMEEVPAGGGGEGRLPKRQVWRPSPDGGGNGRRLSRIPILHIYTYLYVYYLIDPATRGGAAGRVRAGGAARAGAGTGGAGGPGGRGGHGGPDGPEPRLLRLVKGAYNSRILM